MIVLNKSITSKIYHLNCELKIERPINIILLWELCSIPNSKVIYLDLYNDEKMNISIAQYRCSQLNDDFESFKIDCICSNIGIIDPLYWDLCLEINNCDVNLCYEPNSNNIITMYMDGTEKDIYEIINTIKKIDDDYNKGKNNE